MGTESIAKALDNTDSFNVIIGQDTVDAVLEFASSDGRNFISQGGKASFDYIMGNSMPALVAMEEQIK